MSRIAVDIRRDRLTVMREDQDVAVQRRRLTENEKSLLERLLAVEFREVEYFCAQVDHITVTSTCSCGCGTIGFDVDTNRAPRAPSSAWDDNPGPIVEGDSRSYLMLFQIDGVLSELEHVAGFGPRPEDLNASSLRPSVEVTDEWFAVSDDDPDSGSLND